MRTLNDSHVTDVLDVMRATGCLLVHSGGDLIPFFLFLLYILQEVRYEMYSECIRLIRCTHVMIQPKVY